MGHDLYCAFGREMMMTLKKPVHLSLIVIATLLLLWNVVFAWSPRQVDGDAAFKALVWTKYAAGLIKALAYYLAFSIVILGHAICSRQSEQDAEPSTGECLKPHSQCDRWAKENR
jgi:hypothetical protein